MSILHSFCIIPRENDNFIYFFGHLVLTWFARRNLVNYSADITQNKMFSQLFWSQGWFQQTWGSFCGFMPSLQIPEETIQVTLLDELLNFISKVCTFFTVMNMVMMIEAIFLGIAPLLGHPYCFIVVVVPKPTTRLGLEGCLMEYNDQTSWVMVCLVTSEAFDSIGSKGEIFDDIGTNSYTSSILNPLLPLLRSSPPKASRQMMRQIAGLALKQMERSMGYKHLASFEQGEWSTKYEHHTLPRRVHIFLL